MSAKNKEIVEKVNAAFAEGSVEGFLSFCADDVVWTMVGDKTVKGKDAIRQWMASMGIWSRRSLRSLTSSPRVTSSRHMAT